MSDNDFDDIDGILDDILSSGPVKELPPKPTTQKSMVSPKKTKKEYSAPPTVGKEQKVQSKISTFFQADEPKDFMYTLDKLLEEKEQEQMKQESSPSLPKPNRSRSDPWLTSSSKKNNDNLNASSPHKKDNDDDDDDEVPSFEPPKKRKKTKTKGNKENPTSNDSIADDDDADIFAPINHFTNILKSQRVQEETKIIRGNFFKNKISLPDILKTSPYGKTLSEWETIITSGLLRHIIEGMSTESQKENVLDWLFKVVGSHTNKKLVYILTEQLQQMYISNTGNLILEMLAAHGGDVPGLQNDALAEEPTLSESQKARKSLPERDHNLAAIFQLACSETTFPTEDIPDDVIVPLFQCLVSISIDSYYKFQSNEPRSLDASRTASFIRTLLNKIIVCANAREISLVEILLNEKSIGKSGGSKPKSYKNVLKRIEAIPILSSKSRLLRLDASWAALGSLIRMASVDSEGYSIETLTETVIPAVKSASDKSVADAIMGIAVPSILNDLCLGDNIVIDKNVSPVQNFIDAIELNMRGSLVSTSLREDILLFTDFLKKIIKEYN